MDASIRYNNIIGFNIIMNDILRFSNATWWIKSKANRIRRVIEVALTDLNSMLDKGKPKCESVTKYCLSLDRNVNPVFLSNLDQ